MERQLTLQGAVPLLCRLAKEHFLGKHVVPLLEETTEADEWYVAHRWEGENDSYSPEIFVWAPGTRTKIHDDSSWGAYYCVVGSVLEERYERLDNGSRLEHARLKKIWQLSWSSEDGASTVLPGDGGTHRVGNPGGETAILVHLYGPRTSKFLAARQSNLNLRA